MTTTISYTSDYKTVSDESHANSTITEKYEEIFGQTPVFNSVKAGEKAGFKGWDNPDTLKTVNEIGFLLNRNRNIAIRLGVETDRGYTVCFDKESYGNVPDSVIERIEEYAVSSWTSQSGGYNTLLTVSKAAYEHLDGYKEKVTFEGDKHDLEVLTSGYALVPPSRIDDESAYQDLQIYPDTPTVEIDSIREILDSIPIEKKEDREKGKSRTKGSSSDSCVEHSSLPSDFDIEQHFKENVAYFSENMNGKESHFLQFIQELKDNQPRIKDKWDINPEDRSRNEKMLAIDLAWVVG